MTVRKWIWIVPLVLLAADCSKRNTPQAAVPAGGAVAAVQGNPEPVAPAPAQPEPAQPQTPLAAEPPEPTGPPPAAHADLVIPGGSRVRVRIDQEVDTRRNRAGDRFSATLYEPVVAHGVVVLPVGTRFRGHLTAAAPSRRLRGRAVLGLTLDSFLYHGREYRVETSSTYRESRSHKRRNIGFIAGGSGFGATIGAIAGGGVGAAIGAAAGGGAGVAGAIVTGRKQVAVAAEAPLTFTLRERVRI